jgi:PET assembly of cytochrome c oxidase, mitochondrial
MEGLEVSACAIVQQIPRFLIIKLKLLADSLPNGEMQKAAITLAAVCGLTGVSVWYSHKIKVDQKERMHAGVVRDLALEAQQRQEQEQALLSQAAAKKASDVSPECESGVCDLKAMRYRDPSTGKTYEPGLK